MTNSESNEIIKTYNKLKEANINPTNISRIEYDRKNKCCIVFFTPEAVVDNIIEILTGEF